MQGCGWTFANVVSVRAFRVHLCETLARCRETSGPLRMLRLSKDFVYSYMIRCLGAGKRLNFCKCCAYQEASCTSM